MRALWARAGWLVLFALPVLVSSVLGFVWLHERGWLLIFALGSAALLALARLALWLVQRRAARLPVPATLDGPAPDPGWTEAETAAFNRARGRIRARLATPLPWDALPAEAVAVVGAVADDLSGGQRGALDFTVPEALLLIDRVALRYRRFLLDHVPYADRVSVRAMHWAWSRQDTAQAAWETGFLAWRGVRLILNPASALVREAERLLAQGLQGHVTDALRRDAQAIFLEEAAQAAIDLYSGRMRASDAELAALALPGPEAPLAPLQVLVCGQPGAGKSALAELLGDIGAPAEVAEHAFGADAARDAARLRQADLVVWAHRAARPGRAIDAGVLAALGEAGAPVVHVLTGCDALGAPWPPAPGDARVAALVDGVAAELGIARPVPLSLRAPVWNAPALSVALAEALPRARRAQRVRLLERAAQGSGLRANVARAGRGAQAVLRRLTGRQMGRSETEG